MGSIRRARELSEIAPQYISKSGLCGVSELETSKWGSIKIQHVTGLGTASEGKSRFPKLDECAHFHYEHVEIGPLKVSIIDDDNLKPLSNESDEEKWWSLSVESQNKSWLIRRSYDNFRMLDQQLHRCIYDRKFSELTELPVDCIEDQENIHNLLEDYMKRFSVIAGNIINCGPILNWLEIDNRGHRLLVPDNDNCPINTPAVAAAYSVKRYAAQAPDEISFEVGDMISVIDMPPPEESIWWHGKRGFQVGFFPCECVAVIGDKVPRNLHFSTQTCLPTKPVLRKHGKLIAFFRSFILSRPSRRRLKQSGILRERVFGCDLGEHLLNSGHEIPMVLKCCVEFIESHGLVDGIYRLSGVTSNIQKLRNAFDEDRVPGLYEDEAILQDVHSVASLLKMYFRELPNPLCTYQLYHQFVGAVQATQGDDTRLLKMRDVVQKLPPPHYRTLEYLMRHLARVSEKGHETGMTSRNVAIVWAPNLLRCKELEVGGVAALQGVGVQAVVTEFLVCYADLIFCDRLPNFSLPPQQVCTKKCRPKSLAISTPTKLLSLEEARNRALLQASGKTEPEYIEVGGGPANLPAKYHTVIELPGYSRKRIGSKRSPIGWKMLFGKSGRSSQSRKEMENKPSSSSEVTILTGKAMTESDLARGRRHLRPAKSAESLNSSRNSDMADLVEPAITGVGSVEDSLSPMMFRSCEGKGNGHNRSVSHESYFDHLQDQKVQDNLVFDINEIQVNFDLEESEMRIFSEDETIMSTGSGSLTSNTSPRILPSEKLGKLMASGNSVKRLSYPKLANAEDGFDNTQNTDPSPKKQKTNDENLPRSKLEEQLSSSVGDIQFIDSVSPDQTLSHGEVHLIQSPSPVSSLSQLSSFLAPSSPILPHIPHLTKTFTGGVQVRSDGDTRRSLILDHRLSDNKDKQLDTVNSCYVRHSSRPSSTTEGDFYTCAKNVVETTPSDRESSDLTTPETPVCSTYTPLLECEESSLSNKTTPDLEFSPHDKRSSSDNLEANIIQSCLELENCNNLREDVEEFDRKIINERTELKSEKLKTDEQTYPKPEERKTKPVHPYVNIPINTREEEGPKLLETSFDEEPITVHRNSNFTIKYQGISTESSNDSLCNENKDDEFMLPLNVKSDRESWVAECGDFEGKSVETACSNSSSGKSRDQEDENVFGEHLREPTSFEHSTDDQTLELAWTRDDKQESVHQVNSVNFEEEKDESERSLTSVKSENSLGCDFNMNFGNELPVSNVGSSKSVTEEGGEEKDFDGDAFPTFDKKSEDDSQQMSIEIERQSATDQHACEELTVKQESFPLATLKTKSWKGGLLETDLDAPDCRIESDLRTEEKSATDDNNQKQSFSNSNVSQLLSKFESSPTEEDSSECNKEFGGLEGSKKTTSLPRNSRGSRGPASFKGEHQKRPITLERLPMRRKMEKESFDASKVQLGKSKSGSHINEKSPDSEKVDILLSCDFDFSDPQRRERIEKYKEKRRNYLREKYRSDSFKNEKDDIVLKIKEKHLHKGDRGGGKGSATSEKSSGDRMSDLSCGRRSPEKKDKASGQKLWKGLEKDSGRKSCSAEVSGRSRYEQPTASSSLREQSNKKNNFVVLSGERRTTNELNSARSSPEKKNNFLNFSLGGLTKEEAQSQVSPIRRKASRRSIDSCRNSECASPEPGGSSDCTKVRVDGSEREIPQSPVMCIKDMAALFEGRNDSTPARQYLSSV
ncbi:hypothetical protein RUM43_001685 [Polyplax serrata]|uniref:Rho GTPase-activating protein 32 n=1 Tax=Polyplax serrata TaxID=468196 RepID=A0AAN8SEA0_POLSC